MQEQTDTIPQLTEKKATPKKNTPAKRISTKSAVNKSISGKNTADINLSDKKSDLSKSDSGTPVNSGKPVKSVTPVKPVAKKKPSTTTKKVLAAGIPSTPLQHAENEALSPTQLLESTEPTLHSRASVTNSASTIRSTHGKTVAKKATTQKSTSPSKPAKNSTKASAQPSKQLDKQSSKQPDKQSSEQKLNRYFELSQEDSSELICILEKAAVLNQRPLNKKAPFLTTYKPTYTPIQVTENIAPVKPAKNKTQKQVLEPSADFKELSFKTLVRALKTTWLKKNTLDEVTDTETPLLPSAPMPTPRNLDLKSQDPLTPFKGKFNKESINELPLVHYEGEVCLVNSLEDIEPALELLKNDTVLGFDTETKPNFHKGKTSPPCLLQLAGENAIVLFQFKQAGFCQALADILSNPKIIKSGIAVADDVRGLNRLLEFKARNMIDLTAIMKKAGLETFGMRNMAANLLGVRISKSAQCSNWSNVILTPQQIRYAATDAWISRLLYMRALELDLISD